MTLILIVDDEPAVCGVIELVLGREGYAVIRCADGRAALDALPCHDFAAALVDLGLEHVQGRHVVEMLREANPALPIVVMSGALASTETDDLPGLRAGLDRLWLLPKPFKPRDLIALVSEITSATLHHHGQLHRPAPGRGARL
jgi:two-component system, OmpR family, response regulator